MLRIGILSAASIAPTALVDPARLVDGVQVTAVAARDRRRAEEFADRHDIATVLDSYSALCSSDLVDAVYICTPATLHHHWTLAALAAGKHVLCEKPLAANAVEAAEMVAAGLAADRVMMEAFHWKYHPLAQRIRTICADDLGAIEHMEASFTIGHLTNRAIQFDLSLGGGSLMDLGVYPLQWVRWVAQDEPSVISAHAVCDPPGMDLQMDADLHFGGSGVTAHIHSSMQPGGPMGATLAVRGSRGTLHVVNPLAPQMGSSLTVVVGDESRTEEVERSSTYEHQLRAFVAAVASGQPPLTGGADSIATMTAVDAIYRAAGLLPRGTTV